MNTIIEVTAHKKQVREELRQLKRSGSSPEEVTLLIQKFHLLICQHSKLVKEARLLTAKMSAYQMRKECQHDIHKSAHNILDDDSDRFIQLKNSSIEFTWLHPRPSFVPSGCTRSPLLSLRRRYVELHLASSPRLHPALSTRFPTPSSRGVPPCCLY